MPKKRFAGAHPKDTRTYMIIIIAKSLSIVS